VPEGAAALTDFSSTRGVPCSPVSGKLYAKILRKEIAPVFSLLALDRQFGAVPGGGTTSPSVAVDLLYARGRFSKRSVGIVCADLRAAFCSATMTVLAHVSRSLSVVFLLTMTVQPP
jgi:hypothetical protein